MRRGAARIVQAALASNDGRWFGYADVLRRIETPSPNLGAWSYEAIDTKLAEETKGATILQLSVYSDAIGEIQGRAPEYFYVVTPAEEERYRVSDYAAYFRLMRNGLLENAAATRAGRARRRTPSPWPTATSATGCRSATSSGATTTTCRSSRTARDCSATSWPRTASRRSKALGREQPARGFQAVARCAGDLRPPSGSGPAAARGAQDQHGRGSRRCRSSRTSACVCFRNHRPATSFSTSKARRGPVTAAASISSASCRFDGAGESVYDDFKAFDDAQEKAAFEAVIDRLIAAFDAHPDMHVYHFGALRADGAQEADGPSRHARARARPAAARRAVRRSLRRHPPRHSRRHRELFDQGAGTVLRIHARRHADGSRPLPSPGRRRARPPRRRI